MKTKQLIEHFADTDEQAYTNLANAIITKAVQDYKIALQRDLPNIQKECERFFNSEWFEVLTNLDGKTIMRRIRELVDKK